MKILRNIFKKGNEMPKNVFVYTTACTFIVGLVTHAFGFMNGLFTHDSLFIGSNDNEWQISLGRFMQPFYRSLRAPLEAPWLLGLLSLLYISITAYLIIKLLTIKSKVGICIVSSVLVSNITVTLLGTTYLYCLDTFMLALLLSALGVFVLEHYRFGFIAGGVICVVSLGLYQSYICVAITLIVLLRFKEILNNKNFRDILVSSVKSIAMLLIGGVLYPITIKVTLNVTGVALSTDYNSIATVGDYTGISVIELISKLYLYFFNFFFEPTGYQTVWTVASTVILLFICLYELVSGLTKQFSLLNIFLLVASLIILPLGANFVFLLSKGMISELMIFAFVLLYVLVVVVLEEKVLFCDHDNRTENMREGGFWEKAVVYLCFGIIVFNSIVFANDAYLKRELEDKAGLSLMTRVVDHMEQVEGYIPGETPVIFIGTFDAPKSSMYLNYFSRYKQAGIHYPLPVTYYGTYYRYFVWILQRPISMRSEAESKEWGKREDVISMPIFPDNDSICMIDGTLVVKLSNS